MTDQVLLWTAILSLLGGIIQLAMLSVTILKVQTIYHATNSMKDELVKEVRAAAYSQGRKEQKDENHARSS